MTLTLLCSQTSATNQLRKALVIFVHREPWLCVPISDTSRIHKSAQNYYQLKFLKQIDINEILNIQKLFQGDIKTQCRNYCRNHMGRKIERDTVLNCSLSNEVLCLDF